MTLPKLTHSATRVSKFNRQRIINALPATQQELQDKLYLSRACISRHICALKVDKQIHITAYTKPTNRGQGAGTYIETYKAGKGRDAVRPALFDDKDWQRAKMKKLRESGAIEDYNRKQRNDRFLARKVPKLDPLAIMYARNEQANISGVTGND